MPNPQSPPKAPSAARLPVEAWAAIAAALFILLIVFGALPRMPW